MRFPLKCLFAAAFALTTHALLAQPANDECTNAIVLTPVPETTCSTTTPGTTVGATFSDNSCNPSGADVWYSFVATAGAHTLDLSNVVYANGGYAAYFTVEIYSGPCSDLHRIFCSPWYYFSQSIPFGDLTPGQTYFFRIADPYSDGLNFGICLSTPPAPPVNDACSGAVMLAVDPDESADSPLAGTTQDATISPVPVCNDCYWGYDVWYSFTATQANHRIELAGIVSAQNMYESQQLSIQALSGSCGNFTVLLSTAVYSGGQFVLTNLSPGNVYYLRLHSSNYSVPCQFSIGVSSPLAPANDECSGAETVAVSSAMYCEQYFSGSTYLATSSGSNCQGGVSNDVWYQFVAISVSHRVQIFPNTTNQTGYEVYAGDCGSLTSLVCVSGDGQAVILNDLTAGASYYLRLFSGPNTYFDFSGCIQTLPAPPANDLCSNAESLPVNPDLSCTQQVNASTLGAAGNAQNCPGTAGTHDVWYSFVATQTTHRLSISLNYSIFGDYYNLGYEVFSGDDCNSLVSQVCQPEFYNPAMLTGLTPGASYLVRVYSDLNTAHNFNICIQSPPPPPANDECAQATVLTPAAGPACDSPTAGTTAGVLTASPSNCAYGSGMDVWYSFTATQANHIVRVSDVQVLYGDYAYWLEMYEGSDCNNLTYVNCYNYPGVFFLNNLVAGQTYQLRWVSAPGSAHSFNICIGTLPPPANDDCANAVALSVAPDLGCVDPVPGTIAGSTFTPPASCFENGDVWYTFVATQSAHQVVLSNVVDIENGYFQPLWAELLTGTCGSLTSLYCLNDPGFATGYLTFGDLVAGQTYYLRIASLFNSALNFDICVLTPPPPPVNDVCAAATVLTPQPEIDCSPIPGTTHDATSSSGLPPVCCGGGDVWYSFTAEQANQAITLSNIQTDGYPAAATVELYASACGNFLLLGSQFVYSYSSWYRTDFVPGNTYYIRVLPAYTQWIDFDICVSSTPAPVNDECAQALPLPTDLNCGNTFAVATLGATQSQPECNGISQANDLWYQFTATEDSYRFDVSVQIGDYYSLGYELFGGTCDNLSSLQCGFLPYNGTFTVHGLNIGDTYYVRWFSGPNSSHNFTVCARPLPPPPANDACSGAFVLNVDPDLVCDALTPGTTLSADPSETSCYGYPSQDVWYTFTATNSSHLLQIEATYGYFGGLYDFGFQVYSGDCGNLTSLLCQDFLFQNEYVLSNLTPGQTYFLRVYSLNFNAHDFTLCLLTLPPPPVNDPCTDATPVLPNEGLACDNIYPGTTLSATYGPNYAQPDVWYSFTATSNSHVFELSNVNQVLGLPGGLSFDIYQGSDCEALNYLAQFNAGYTAILNYLQAGETYFIRVHPDDLNSAFTFDLCIKTLPPSPANEECAGALVLTPNENVECVVVTPGSTAGAITGGYPSCGNGYDVWFRFTATASNHRLQLLNIIPVLGNGAIWLDLLQGQDCDNLYHLNCTFGDQALYLSGLTPGAVYYVKVSSEYNTAHDFDLCLSTLPPPTNDLCDNATALEVAPESICLAGTPGTTLGAGPSNFPTCSNYGNDVWYSFTATQSTHTVSVNNVVDSDSGYDTYFAVEVYRGACGDLQNLTCRSGLYSSDQFIVGDLTPGEQYYIRIFPYYTAIDFEICVTTPPPAPDNDVCTGALPIAVSPNDFCLEYTHGTTLDATQSVYSGNGCYTAADVWYSFVATRAAHTVEVFNTEPDYGGMRYEVLTGDCGNLTSLGCFYLNQSLISGLIPGQTYYLKIGSYYPIPMSFDVCVATPLPDPAVSYIYPFANSCGATNNETVFVWFTNLGIAPLPAGAAEYTLTVSGANSGTYGPFYNTYPLTSSGEYLYFTGVDLSNVGLSQISATVTSGDDANIYNNTITIDFNTLPVPTYYLDADLDGYGNPLESIQNCYDVYGYVTDNTDCDDTNPAIHPGAAEWCNGLDNDCDGLSDSMDPNVVDTLPPGIICPANIVTNNETGSCSAVVDYTVTASDDCAFTITQDSGLASGSDFPVGTTTNIFTASDPGGHQASCSFTVEVKKTGDPELLYAYTAIGFNEVFLKKNTVQSGGVGVVNANKKARLQQGTLVTAPNTFVKTPVLELQGGSQATTVYTGQVPSGLLPAFQPNNNPGNNNVNIPNNSAPVTLTLSNYGNVTVGKNVSVTFSGPATVQIKQLTLKEGVVVHFAQGTTLLIDKTLDIAQNVSILPSGAGPAQFFVEGQVTVGKGSQLTTHLYTLATLVVNQADAGAPTYLTGLFIADKVQAQDNVFWNWDAGYCPYQPGGSRPATAESVSERDESPAGASSLQLFPNPATDEVRLAFDAQSNDEATVLLYEATGRLVYSETITTLAGANLASLSLANVAEGMYLVQVQTGGQSLVARLVVARP